MVGGGGAVYPIVGRERELSIIMYVEDEVPGCNTIILELVRFRLIPYLMKHSCNP